MNYYQKIYILLTEGEARAFRLSDRADKISKQTKQNKYRAPAHTKAGKAQKMSDDHYNRVYHNQIRRGVGVHANKWRRGEIPRKKSKPNGGIASIARED